MKTYLRRDPQSVEPQKARFVEAPEPRFAPPSERSVTAPRGLALYVGLDVHTDSIAVSLAPSDSAEVHRYGLIGGTHDDVLRLARKLHAAHPGPDAEVLLRSRSARLSLVPLSARAERRALPLCAGSDVLMDLSRPVIEHLLAYGFPPAAR